MVVGPLLAIELHEIKKSKVEIRSRNTSFESRSLIESNVNVISTTKPKNYVVKNIFFGGWHNGPQTLAAPCIAGSAAADVTPLSAVCHLSLFC